MNLFDIKLATDRIYITSYDQMESDKRYVLESITADFGLWNCEWKLGDIIIRDKDSYNLQNTSVNMGGLLSPEGFVKYKIKLSVYNPKKSA